jgi:hypothetical protein
MVMKLSVPKWKFCDSASDYELPKKDSAQCCYSIWKAILIILISKLSTHTSFQHKFSDNSLLHTDEGHIATPHPYVHFCQFYTSPGSIPLLVMTCRMPSFHRHLGNAILVGSTYSSFILMTSPYHINSILSNLSIIVPSPLTLLLISTFHTHTVTTAYQNISRPCACLWPEFIKTVEWVN